MKISPSLLAADFANLQASVAKIERTVEMLHLDVMDGNFVPNLSFGPNVIEALRPHSNLFFEHTIKPDACTSAISFSKWMSNIHFNILFNNFIKG